MTLFAEEAWVGELSTEALKQLVVDSHSRRRRLVSGRRPSVARVKHIVICVLIQKNRVKHISVAGLACLADTALQHDLKR